MPEPRRAVRFIGVCSCARGSARTSNTAGWDVSVRVSVVLHLLSRRESMRFDQLPRNPRRARRSIGPALQRFPVPPVHLEGCHIRVCGGSASADQPRSLGRPHSGVRPSSSCCALCCARGCSPDHSHLSENACTQATYISAVRLCSCVGCAVRTTQPLNCAGPRFSNETSSRCPSPSRVAQPGVCFCT